MASSTIVIKVKFGKTLRRFIASIQDMKLALDIAMLREKIRNFFSFNYNVEFTLTYVDEDGDTVTLADDDDLHDIVRQSLNPLRINVKLNKVKPGHLKSPTHQLPYQTLNSGSTSSVPGVSELVKKMKATNLNQISGSTASPTVHLHPPTGDLSNVNSESSTVKDSKVQLNPEAGSSNSKKKEKQVQKGTEVVDLNVPYFEYESFQTPINSAKGVVETSTAKDKNTTDDSGNSSSLHWESYINPDSIFHSVVRCYDCGVHCPITGTRFKSRLNENYDLCSVCFDGKGKVATTSFRHHTPFNGFQDPVDDVSMKDLGESSINLNLPPLVKNPEVFNQGHVTDSHFPGFNSIKVTDSEATSVDSKINDQGMSLPIYDLMIIDNDDDGDVSSTMATLSPAAAAATEKKSPQEGSTGFFSEVRPKMVSGAPSSPPVEAEVQPSSGSGSKEVSDEQVQALVKDLEEMGFKQLDLNKEILTRNNYDLEKSIDDLCGASEWDQMLNKLQEMGFTNDESNIRLLKKNNGSIKRVVMDLIYGEKA